ncbi:MAG: hypothetical protein ACFFBD_15145 [Candidatus Hodarchaeota archaeon]
MKRKNLILAILLCLGVFLVLNFTASTVSLPEYDRYIVSYQYSGHVKDSQTHSPLSGAKVYVKYGGKVVGGPVSTSSSGYFNVGFSRIYYNPPPSTLNVQLLFRHSNYLPKSVSSNSQGEWDIVEDVFPEYIHYYVYVNIGTVYLTPGPQ